MSGIEAVYSLAQVGDSTKSEGGESTFAKNSIFLNRQVYPYFGADSFLARYLHFAVMELDNLLGNG